MTETREQPSPPTGRQYEIRHGAQVATITEQGATLRAYAVEGRPVVEEFPADEAVAGGHGQVLMPWTNRVAGGRWSWAGKEQQLALTEPGKGNAIHGLVRWMPWNVVAHTGGRIELEVLVGSQPGWPAVMRCTAVYELGADGLAVTLSGTNIGAAACPWGAGSHPYLATPGGVDTAVVTLDAQTYLTVDGAGIPTGRGSVADAGTALDGAAPLGDRIVDTAFTDLRRTDAGDIEVIVLGSDGWRTALRAGPEVGWVQVFTGDTLSERYRRTALAVEPMTCPPDALNTGTDLVTLEPGETGTMTWRLSATPPS